MPITPLPVPVPTTSDPANFDVRADLFLSALPTFATEANALAVTVNGYAAAAAVSANSAVDAQAAAAVAIAATAYAATSSSSLSLTAGSKAVHLNELGKAFAIGDQITLIRRSDPNARMTLVATAWDGVDDITGTVSAGSIVGSGGPFNDWVVILAVWSLPGATGADLLAMTSSLVGVTPASMKAALVPFVLTDAATVTPSGLNGLDFNWTIGASRTLAAITNTYPGARGRIKITIGGAGNWVLTVNSAYKRVGGPGTISLTAGLIDYLEYEVDTVDGSNTATRIIHDILKAPS